MLISKMVLTGVGRNLKHFENLGYEIPRTINNKGIYRVEKGTKILVKVEDLPFGSRTFVDLKCDVCGAPIKKQWSQYQKNLLKSDKDYCVRCGKSGAKRFISFYVWCYDNLSKNEADNIMKRWDYTLNIGKDGNVITPKDISYGTKISYYFKCLDHPEHESEKKNINNFTNGQHLNCSQCNSIAITHPNIIKYLIDKNEAHNISKGTKKPIAVKCPNCGHEKEIKIGTLIRYGFACPKCSDGLPYSEKFIFNVIEQLLNNKEFQTQLSHTTFKWCNGYVYDFYISKINGIIESMGIQHYEESFTKLSKKAMTLEETKENDKQKEQLARQNGIENYIILDCRKSELEWIKNSIMNSKLPTLLGFKEEDVDWLKCHEYACNSLVKTVCDLWNNGIKSTSEIANEIKIHTATVAKYLKQGVKLEWCNYNPKEVKCKKIICLTTGDIFESIIEASIKYNIRQSTISACCSGTRKIGGRFLGKIPLKWMYYDDYILKTDEQIKEILDNVGLHYNRKVICLTTGEIFNSILKAKEKYNLSGIIECCRNKTKYAGELEDGTKLVWMYYEDYIEKDKEQIKNILDSVRPVKQIICLNTNEIFKNANIAGKKYNISAILDCCNKRINSAGNHPETGERMVWMYYDEYLLKTEEKIATILNNAQEPINSKKVICLTTGEIFKSQREAKQKYSKTSHITDCCKGRIEFSGKHPETGEKLRWMYYDEFIK